MWNVRGLTRVRRSRGSCGAVILLLLLAALARPSLFAAGEQQGLVTFNGLPVPGATVVATQSEKKVVVASDSDGRYRLSGLGDGAYTIRVEMMGFAPLTRDLIAGEQSAALELTLLPFEEMKRIAVVAATAPMAPIAPIAPGAPNAPNAPSPIDPELERQAAEGLLVNGSVNNAAASPFAQSRAFGNARPGQRSLYNGNFGFTFGNAALDARPYSFSAERAPRPDYTDMQFMGSIGGPFKLPGVRNRPVFFAGYQHSSDHNAIAQSAVMPTLEERTGDLSGAREIRDPQTGQPFPGNVIPVTRISPQAAALLALYPAPNVDAAGGYNYETTTVSLTSQDNFQSRVNHGIGSRDSLLGTASFQRNSTEAANVFGFVDALSTSSLDVSATWSHRFSQFLTLRTSYQFLRQTNDATPHFANRVNVSGDAGIAGNNQEPVNWGPPALVFTSGIAGLTMGQHNRQESRIHGFSTEVLWRTRGGHNFTLGGALRPQTVDVVGQQNARGTFSFNGSLTGLDVADFLLGAPHSAAIAFGNAEKSLRGRSANAYIADDWRLNPTLTLNLGVRWEYEAPFSEGLDRLVNLDVAPDFSGATPVVGARLNPDRRGVQPRLGLALRPVPGSSLVIRAGWGIYRNTSVYQSIALMLAQQPPLSKALSIESTPARPLTLASGFNAPGNALSNTFAVDPDFRVSYAHNWQISAQRDLPASLTVIATYLGTKGSHLMQEFVPNTYPRGVVNPCLSCPSGFVYLQSNGSSVKNAAQLQVRRRLRQGLMAVANYTFSKATDDAAAFTTADLSGGVIAQNWLDLGAERASSAFDQRHLLSAQVEYAGRAFLANWVFTSQLTVGSGLPLTPLYLTSLAGTGLTGAVRASYTGAPTDAAPPGFYVNPAAFAPPSPGEWGTAGRNSITGPSQFSLNTGITRTFLLSNRWSMDWRIDATNILNRVTYSGLNTIVGSPQFGLPNRANAMRKLLSSLRVRF
jgi:trimeric autotransporter adhesin